MTKKVALISTYCDSEQKQNVLIETISKLRNFDIDIFCLSPVSLPKEIIDLCDFYYFTKENPVLGWPTRMHTHWFEKQISENEFTSLHRCFYDYGWAGLYQVKKLSQIALSYDYDVFYHLIYDLDFEDVVIQELQSNITNIVHPRINPKNTDEVWDATLHFMIFDRPMMEKIVSEISLDDYLNTNGIAESEVLKWTKKYPIQISEIPIKDRIYHWENVNFFDYSKSDKFKFFISKNDDLDVWIGENPPHKKRLNSNLRIVFYDVLISELSVQINDTDYDIDLKDWEIVEFPISSKKIKTLKIKFQNEIIDFSEDYEKINMNHIYYNYKY